MKMIQKAVALIFVAALVLFCFASCIEKDTARATISDFLTSVEAEDYDTAVSLLHPDCGVDLKEYFEQMERENDVDFGAGIEILYYSGFKSSEYLSTVKGSFYSTTFRAKIGDREVSFLMELVDNDAGYGIYNMNVSFR